VWRFLEFGTEKCRRPTVHWSRGWWPRPDSNRHSGFPEADFKSTQRLFAQALLRTRLSPQKLRNVDDIEGNTLTGVDILCHCPVSAILFRCGHNADTGDAR
jgi:hypothetical protein